MNLYTDDNPHTTLSGLGFKNKQKAITTIKLVEEYFEIMKNQQLIPGYTPINVLPKEYITSKEESNKYYDKQKMYRILGMSNRAKGMLHRVKYTQNLQEAIIVFEKWLHQYKIQQSGSAIKDCCKVDSTIENKCIRQSDGKIFNLPRKYSKQKCKNGVNGYTMKSSCAPFKDCI